MQASINDVKAIVDEENVLARLDTFDPMELLFLIENSTGGFKETFRSAIKDLRLLLQAAEAQLQLENIPALEYMVHKLRGNFLSLGCDRLAYLCERIYRNLRANNLDYIQNRFKLLNDEFKKSLIVMTEFIKNLELSVENTA